MHNLSFWFQLLVDHLKQLTGRPPKADGSDQNTCFEKCFPNSSYWTPFLRFPYSLLVKRNLQQEQLFKASRETFLVFFATEDTVLTFLSCRSTVPLRAPELSLTSHSPVDIQVSWQPLPDKLSRGRITTYRLSYRTSAENTVSQVELPGEKTQHLLENLHPDTIYLLRIVAATSVGWGEQSVWTSHRTPKASSARGTTFGRAILIMCEIAACSQVKCTGTLKNMNIYA